MTRAQFPHRDLSDRKAAEAYHEGYLAASTRVSGWSSDKIRKVLKGVAARIERNQLGLLAVEFAHGMEDALGDELMRRQPDDEAAP